MGNRITHDIIVSAKLKSTSPLVMGAQKGEQIDLEILKHSTGEPYISGTAFAGKLLHFFKNNDYWKFNTSDDKKISTIKQNLNYLLGDGDDYQSHILIEDVELLGASPGVRINDSNKMDKKTGNVAHKFNFEKLKPGATFGFKAHLKIRAGFNVKFFEETIHFIQAILNNDFSVGAKTNKGYGKLEVEQFAYRLFDYTKENEFELWEQYLRTSMVSEGIFLKQHEFIENNQTKESASEKYFEYQQPEKVVFNLNLRIKSQFITGEMALGQHDVDKIQSQREVQNEEDGKDQTSYILKGEAAKNALSHRAYRILNTVNGQDKQWVNDIMLYLFGEDMTAAENHQSAHLKVNESIFNNVKAQKQTRIKISRFTGGTIDGAMVDSMPIHSTNKDQPNFTLTFEMYLENDVKFQDDFSNSVTLMLMLIKDLFTEDLPIGGEKATGKGVLVGCKSTIDFAGQTIEINERGFDLKGNQNPLEVFNTFKIKELC